MTKFTSIFACIFPSYLERPSNVLYCIYMYCTYMYCNVLHYIKLDGNALLKKVEYEDTINLYEQIMDLSLCA